MHRIRWALINYTYWQHHMNIYKYLRWTQLSIDHSAAMPLRDWNVAAFKMIMKSKTFSFERTSPSEFQCGWSKMNSGARDGVYFMPGMRMPIFYAVTLLITQFFPVRFKWSWMNDNWIFASEFGIESSSMNKKWWDFIKSYMFSIFTLTSILWNTILYFWCGSLEWPMLRRQ